MSMKLMLCLAFNQTQVAYNATKEEKLEKLKETISAREAKYKV